MKQIKWLLQFVEQPWKTVLLTCLLSVCGAALEIAPYGLMALLAAKLLAGTADMDAALSCAGGVLGCMLLRAAAHWWNGVQVHKTGYAIVYRIRCTVAEHLAKLPMSFFSRSRMGTLHKVMMEDAEKVETLVCHAMPDLVASVTTPLLSLAALCYVDWRLALCALLPFPLAALCQRGMSRQSAEKIGSYYGALERMNNNVQEYVSGMVTLRTFNLSWSSFGDFAESVRRFRHIVTDWSNVSSKYYALFGTALDAGLLFVLLPGIVLYARGSIALPDLVFCLMLAAGYTQPLDKLLHFGSKVQEVKASVKRLQTLLAAPALQRPATVRHPSGYDIDFDGVRFAYSPEEPLFTGLSMRLAEGTLTAFVGPSGTGKTTAALLLARYQDADGGAIRIGGTDVRDMEPEALMETVSVVFQDPFIFNDTLMENIRCARPGASDAEVLAAARRANADGFIRAFPQGYATLAGEGGTPLSGGERQRIAIARAMLRDTPIIIFDEALAYADAENEYRIQESVNELIKGRTVIVIAHNLARISGADAIAVFGRGGLAGFGVHDDLLRECTVYRTLWEERLQAGSWSFGDEGRRA